MKVLINVSVISKNYRGMGFFAKNLIVELIENRRYEYIFVSGNDIDESLHKLIIDSGCKYVQVNTQLPLFEQLVIPYLIFKYEPDVCWFPSNTFPLFKSKKCIYIATICDLIFLRGDIKPTSLYQIIGKLYRSLNVRYGIKKLNKITSISNTALKEINQVFGMNGEGGNRQVLTVAQDFSNNLDTDILNTLSLTNKKYFYTISGDAPHKNLDFLIKSFLIFSSFDDSFVLVISGASKSKYRNKFLNIIFTDFVTENEKFSLIKHANLFLFVSLVEGFGIPLIEGIFYNERVLASDIEIFREVGSKYVTYINQNDEYFLVDYFKNENKLLVDHGDAKKYIIDNFDAFKTAKKLEAIIDEFS